MMMRNMTMMNMMMMNMPINYFVQTAVRSREQELQANKARSSSKLKERLQQRREAKKDKANALTESKVDSEELGSSPSDSSSSPQYVHPDVDAYLSRTLSLLSDSEVAPADYDAVTNVRLVIREQLSRHHDADSKVSDSKGEESESAVQWNERVEDIVADIYVRLLGLCADFRMSPCQLAFAVDVLHASLHRNDTVS